MHAVIISLLTMLLSAAANAQTFDVEGTWIAPNRDGRINTHVRVSDCGDGTPCGVLVWVDPAATNRRFDDRNPDRSSRHRPLIGLRVLSGFERDGQIWRGGRLYNPDDGMSFACRLERGPDGQLRVTGCLGPLCQTNIWRRLHDD